jgi:D-alanyl-D-alanine carboxypeptidase (penicillin-binding protein 5/6)
MSNSPFLTPTQSRARRALAAKRRRSRQLTALALLALAMLIAGGVLALTSRSKSSAHGSSRRVVAHTAVKAPPAPALSLYGLPLAKPALALTGIADPARDPIQLSFHHPPRAGLLFNLDTGQVLWELDPHMRVPVASLTKMMTALITVKSAPPAAPVLVTRQAVDSNGSKVGVLPLGRHVLLETMLYGLLLPSGNDAAVALAQHVSGSVNAFVRQMNAEAARLGMGCTRYSSPSGYYDSGNFSCAADLAELARADLAQPRIARVTHTYSAVLPFPIKGGKLYLYNNNPLLIYRYPGTTGLKTGYTEAAGRCLVATAERHGVRLGVVILDSTAPGTEAKQLLDRGFHDVYHLPQVPETPMPAGA